MQLVINVSDEDFIRLNQKLEKIKAEQQEWERINQKCSDLIQTLPKLLVDKDKLKKSHDHIFDALRYAFNGLNLTPGVLKTVKLHSLKIVPSYFDDVSSGKKKFEIRKNDRDFLVGDLLNLREWNPETERYTGRELTAKVTYKINGGQYGLDNDYCVLGIEIDSPKKEE